MSQTGDFSWRGSPGRVLLAAPSSPALSAAPGFPWTLTPCPREAAEKAAEPFSGPKVSLSPGVFAGPRFASHFHPCSTCICRRSPSSSVTLTLVLFLNLLTRSAVQKMIPSQGLLAT